MISEVLKDPIICQDILDYIANTKEYLILLDSFPHGFTDDLSKGPKQDNIPFLPKKNGFYEASDDLLDALIMD